MFWFYVASLTPAVLLAAACIWGGLWVYATLGSTTIVVFCMDRLVTAPGPEGLRGSGRALSYTLGLVHFGLWIMGIWAIGANSQLASLDRVLLLISMGLFFGQVSNSNAHELIHTTARSGRRMGTAIYGSLLFAHHTSAHMRVHHVWAGTAQDPSTARLGEGFWRYLVRAWVGGFRAGKHAEDRARSGQAQPVWSHPYFYYVTLSLGFGTLALLVGGFAGLAALVGLAAYAQGQLYLSDYVQHYGLERRISDTGKPEPIGPQHSWNAPQLYSSAMMLNATRHSDHHMNPWRPFPELILTRGQMPILPYSLPVMAMIALIPPLWRRLMDKRALPWRVTAGSIPGTARECA